MNQIVDEYINSINEIPTFKAALLEKENKKIDEKLENDILNQIFNQDNTSKLKIDLMFPLINNLSLSDNFFREYQNRFEQIPNETINYIIFENLNNNKKYVEDLKSGKNNINIYKFFNFHIPMYKEVYEAFNTSKKTTIYSLTRFTKKIKEALSDFDSYPYPYTNGDGLNYAKLMALLIHQNILKEFSPIFSYNKIQKRDVFVNCFRNDFIYAFKKNHVDNEYKETTREIFYKYNPIFIKQMQDYENGKLITDENDKIYLTEEYKFKYLIHNLRNLNEIKFKFFIKDFKREFVTYDLLIEKFKDEMSEKEYTILNNLKDIEYENDMDTFEKTQKTVLKNKL